MGVIAGGAQRTYGNIERNTSGAQRVVFDESSGARLSIGDRQAGEIFVAREPGKVVAPRLKPTILAESRCQIVIAARPVKIMLHLVLASPQHFDWAIDLLRDRGRLDHVIVGQSSPKTAAASNHVNRDVVGIDS